MSRPNGTPRKERWDGVVGQSARAQDAHAEELPAHDGEETLPLRVSLGPVDDMAVGQRTPLGGDEEPRAVGDQFPRVAGCVFDHDHHEHRGGGGVLLGGSAGERLGDHEEGSQQDGECAPDAGHLRQHPGRGLRSGVPRPPGKGLWSPAAARLAEGLLPA